MWVDIIQLAEGLYRTKGEENGVCFCFGICINYSFLRHQIWGSLALDLQNLCQNSTSLASQIFGLKCDYIAGALRKEVFGQNQSSSIETDIRDYWAPWRHDPISYHSHLYYLPSYLSIAYLPVIGPFLFIIPSINSLWIILTSSEWCSLNACSQIISIRI